MEMINLKFCSKKSNIRQDNQVEWLDTGYLVDLPDTEYPVLIKPDIRQKSISGRMIPSQWIFGYRFAKL